MTLEMNPKTQKETFLKELDSHLALYEGCGNMLGIVPLTLTDYYGDEQSWKSDPELREFLTRWGKEIHSDSVMVLFGDPHKLDEQGYHVKMFVFEPSGDDGSGLGGGISITMWGSPSILPPESRFPFNPALHV